MDTEGPVSVLDRRTRSCSRDRVIADRITRQRSPGPSFRHRGRTDSSKTSILSTEDDNQEELVYRIPQPYRTSFSAKYSVTWGKVDRSRSLSPTSSVRSDLSHSSYCSAQPALKAGTHRHRPRGQSKSPKRVTYNSRVTVRHSDTDDSVFTELSSYECDDDSTQPKISPFSRSLISPKYNEFSQPLSDSRQTHIQYSDHRRPVRDITNLNFSSAGDHSGSSHDSGVDYSVELRDLSDQIAKLNWSPKHARTIQSQPKHVPSSGDHYYTPKQPSPPGILKTSQESYSSGRDWHAGHVPSDHNGNNKGVNKVVEQPSSRQAWSSLQEDQTPTLSKQNGIGLESPPLMGGDPPSLRDDGVSSSPADTSQGEVSPGRGSPVESGRLTPSKRSVSLSITNFLKRVSPHFRRKRSKDQNKKSSSAESSAQSLANTSDPDTDPDISHHSDKSGKNKRPSRFSRSRVRQSFLKLVGGSTSRSKKKKKGTNESSHYTIQPQDPDKQTSSDEVDDLSNGFIHQPTEGAETLDVRTQDTLTPNSDLNPSLQLQDPSSHPATPCAGPTNGLPQTPVTVEAHSPYVLESQRSRTNAERMDFFTESDIKAILHPHVDRATPGSIHVDHRTGGWRLSSPSRSTPPSSLDVMPAQTKRILQTSMMSSISGDESIGDCSLDVNLTASEPSLLSGASQSGGSRQVVIPHSLVNSTEGPPTSDVDTAGNYHRVTPIQEIQANSFLQDVSRSDPSSPTDPSHKPSYLKLSCAVSGYGKYSRYSTYKDVFNRSPTSSHSSLRSSVSSPDTSLQAGSGDESTPHSRSQQQRPRSLEMSEKRLSVRQAVSPTLAVNGHVPVYPTGDTKKDGEYFLQSMLFEEERIKGLSLRAEGDLRSQDLPEEASGRIRAATGKANLLVSQKFVQFRELCHNHMQRSPGERETKWEDLQGFWDIVRIQVDNVDDMFAEIELMKQNGWQEIPELVSKFSSAASSPRSGTVSQGSTPCVTPSPTPGSKRKNVRQGRGKDTPESSPEEAQKVQQATRARDEARRKLLSEKRAAMKQARPAAAADGEAQVEIYLQETSPK